MTEKNLITSAELFVQERLGDEATGHDWWHANRVRNVALQIHDVEGGDKNVIELASLLHDVGDRKVINEENDNYAIAEDFLRAHEVGAATINSVMYVIQNISYSKSIGTEEVEKPIELQIVQDADRFDALGAIGIARAFAFGGSRGRPIYDPTYSAQVFASTADYKAADGSTLHHFDEKLFLLKDKLNTETAKRIAEERDAYMHEFYSRFLEEWEGNIS